MKYLLLQILPRDAPDAVPAQRVEQHLRSLKNNKAADPYGVTVEHLKLDDPILTKIMTKVLNKVLATQTVPYTLKLGILMLVLKKNKAKTDPNSYRWITE